MYVRPSQMRRRRTAHAENFEFWSQLGGGGLKSLKALCTRFPLAGIEYIFKFLLTCSPLTYSMALDAYHIDSVNTCYDMLQQ